MPMLLPTTIENVDVAEEACTSPKTLSNQVIAAGTSRNSSPHFIYLGIPLGDGQYGSTSSKGILESWFKTTYFQLSLSLSLSLSSSHIKQKTHEIDEKNS
jgi:hypothetical protein